LNCFGAAPRKSAAWSGKRDDEQGWHFEDLSRLAARRNFQLIDLMKFDG
jgi:hypothetical protein